MVGSTVDLSNTELSGNTAQTKAGAIFLANGSANNTGNLVKLTNVTIQNNHATTNAAGAINVGEYRKLEIDGTNTLISGNTAERTGGAIGTGASASITMKAGTISNNKSKNHKDGGGAVFLWNATFNMTGGTISGNTAEKGPGGAIVGAGSSAITMSTGTISGNTTKVTGGGGIYLRETTVLTMTSGSISGNTVASGLNGENVYINSGTTVKLAENANLQSVYFAAGNTPIQVTGSTLNNPVTVTCTSANQAGTLVVKKAVGSTVDLKQLCESGKIIVGAGFDDTDYALIETDQGMAWTAVTKVTTFADLKNAIESTNNALQYVKVETPLSVNETISVQNNANIIFIGDATLTRASGFKGEFFNVAAGSTLTMEGTTKDNKLILDGAKSTVTAEKPLIYNTGTLNINEGVVLQNNKNNSTSGGAIYTATAMDLENATISGNEVNYSKGYGGAIFLDNGSATTPGKVTLTNVTIKNNSTSAKAGGAIYVAKYRQLEINGANTLIDGNTTGDTGGAIGTNTGAIVTMNAGTISGNKTTNAKDGGAIYLWQATFVMNGGKISENAAGVDAATAKSGKGGAIFVSTGSTLSLSNGEISNNTAYYRGGAIYIDIETSLDELMKFTNVIIKDNKATTNSAGAIYVGKYRNIEIGGEATLISGNSSGTTAGAITTGEGVNFSMKAGTISGNTAKGGDGAGGIYFWSTANALTTFTMSGGTISGNTDARTNGDAPNVRAHGTAIIKISDNASLESVYWQEKVGKIQVTAPLTAENATTVITLPAYTAGTTVVSYTGTTETDMSALAAKFSLANPAYKLNVSDKNLNVSAAE